MKDKYQNRFTLIIFIFSTIFILFVFRLLYIQVIDSKWKNHAENVSISNRNVTPARGTIFDRNKKPLASNRIEYYLNVFPNELEKFDTVELCNLLNIDVYTLILKLDNMKKDNNRQLITNNIPKKNLARLKTIIYRYKGFELQEKIFRYYPEKIAAHVLGYVSEVNSNVLQEDNYYIQGDLIGSQGLEKSYERYLRGERGQEKYIVDNKRYPKEKLSHSDALKGLSITSTLDLELQKYGEMLMNNKVGSIVAIEPSTGEILAMISAPTFDPNILSGDSLSYYYKMLNNNDTTNPLYNRAVYSKFPPGSTFKVVQGLTTWQMGAITQNTGIGCNKKLVNCHGHPSAGSLGQAIKYSCNPYFFVTFLKMNDIMDSTLTKHEKSKKALSIWNSYIESFGLGVDIQLDYPGYSYGNIPNYDYYDKRLGKNSEWKLSTINSIAIGQGEVLVTPIQLSNLASIIANKGYYYYPHLVKYIDGKKLPNEKYYQKNYTKISKEKFYYIADAMEQVVSGVGGTARKARIDSIIVCGKTGTVQNPGGADHSVFIAFAPKDNPKIAIAVIVENSGFGGTWAAPIAGLMIEKYVRGYVKNKSLENTITKANLINKYNIKKRKKSNSQ